MVKNITFSVLFFFSFYLLACDLQDELPETGSPDPLITLEDAEAQDYNLITPLYEMQVSIRGDVDGDIGNILDKLDERGADFLDCQFALGAEIGFQAVQIDNGDIVPPLSELRVFVVPFTFKCTAVDRDVCAGIHFSGPDLIVISKESIGQCKDFSFWKHELGHRYGMAADHSNQRDFEPCINPPGCQDLPFGIGD
jgi:hypothetical protein